MKIAFVILGCLLVVALSDFAQSKAIVDLETRDVAADSKEMTDDHLFSDGVESKIIDVVRDLVVRATEKEDAEGQGGFNMFTLMKRVTQAVQIIRTRDIHAGIEFIKQLLMEFFFPH